MQEWVQASPLQGLTEAFPTRPIDDEEYASDNTEHTLSACRILFIPRKQTSL